MRNVEVLLTSDIGGGMESFRHGDLTVRFHRWADRGKLPLLEGTICAFVDWLLPDMAGVEICRRLRSHPLTARAHITMVLDESGEEARRRSLLAGADDYIVGEIDRTAVLDRILSMHPDESGSGFSEALSAGGFTIDLVGFQARWRGKPIRLMPNEFRLLRYFVENPGRVFSRAQLIAALGKQHRPIDERTVDVWIKRLRRALKTVGAGDPLRTVRALGYVLDLP